MPSASVETAPSSSQGSALLSFPRTSPSAAVHPVTSPIVTASSLAFEQEVLGIGHTVSTFGARSRRKSSAVDIGLLHPASRLLPSSTRSSLGTSDENISSRNGRNPFARLYNLVRYSAFVKEHFDFYIPVEQHDSFSRYIYQVRMQRLGALVFVCFPLVVVIVLLLTVVVFGISGMNTPLLRKRVFVTYAVCGSLFPLWFTAVTFDAAKLNKRKNLLKGVAFVVFSGIFTYFIYSRYTYIIPAITLVFEVIGPFTLPYRRAFHGLTFFAWFVINVRKWYTGDDLNECTHIMASSGLVKAIRDQPKDTSEDFADAARAFALQDPYGFCTSFQARASQLFAFYIVILVVGYVLNVNDRKSFVILFGLYDSKVALAIQ